MRKAEGEIGVSECITPQESEQRTLNGLSFSRALSSFVCLSGYVKESFGSRRGVCEIFLRLAGSEWVSRHGGVFSHVFPLCFDPNPRSLCI